MSDAQNTDLSFLKMNREAREPDQPKRRPLLVGGLAIAIVLIVVGLIWLLTGGETAGKTETGLAVLTTPAQENTLLTSSGYVVAQRKAAVASKGTGRLEELSVIEGDRVKQGQIIGRIESGDVEAAYDQASASVSISRATLSTAQVEKEEAILFQKRQAELFRTNLISKSEMELADFRLRRAEAAYLSAEASVQVSEANLKAASVAVENTRIRAPFDGVVLTKNANVGEVISPFGAAAGSRGAVVTIADMTSLEVEAEVSESSIQSIREGMNCEIMLDAYPSVRYNGFVNKVVPTADRAKATVLTKVRFRTLDEKVLPEMRAKVNFLNEKSVGDAKASVPKLTVPITAVTDRDGEKVVFVIANGIVDRRVVSTGEASGSRIEILSGVQAGERVILRPAETLKSGDQMATE
ncbi:MAG: efflux RND transporter periplasmic adaptor subunit [Bacteroidetes bacterium]|nr:efflux RND transporter periplasmic adaptor subunit [Bacteroidota bacterium]